MNLLFRFLRFLGPSFRRFYLENWSIERCAHGGSCECSQKITNGNTSKLPTHFFSRPEGVFGFHCYRRRNVGFPFHTGDKTKFTRVALFNFAQEEVERYLNGLAADCFDMGIRKLEQRLQKCVNRNGDYVEE